MRRPPKKLPWFAALAVAVIGVIVQGGGKAPKDKGAAKAEVAQAVAAIPATNVSKLKEAKGESINVSGRVAKANVSSSGTHFLNFDGSAFKVVCLADLAKRFPGGGPAALYKGKSIIVSGKIELYKGDPQIKVTGPDQIQVIGGGSSSIASSGSGNGKAPSAGNFKLQQVGKTTWQSPAGLTYKGRDPKGLTRVEHIMRHAQDQPGRAGKHGVFDGNTEAEVFALLDQAWARAEQQGVRANNQGGRSVLTVSMGRRVGYLGGRVGAERRKPALSKVRIVFETGTKNIVTAFPS